MTGINTTITPEILERHDKPGPRYTSYPPVPAWHGEFEPVDYRNALRLASETPDEPLAMYVHIPFCRERCWYCGCNVVISKKPEIVEEFLEHVERELDRVSDALGERRNLSQLHFGGGTPTYLSPEQLEELYSLIADRFRVLPDAEVAIEVDPRVTSPDQLSTLRSLGFNRISLGVQDLTPEVQAAIGRNQSLEETQQLVGLCRELGFSSVNIDLIYGLPKQTLKNWKRTIEATVGMSPDRLAIYSFAHLPDNLKHQKKIDEDALPNTRTKFALMATARAMLLDAGYEAIGMDHFAKIDDELAVSMREGRLRRNFMGYSTVEANDMVGIGPSAIGQIGGAFNQNDKRLFKYYRELDEGRLPTCNGMLLSEDDRIRAWVVEQLMCRFAIDYGEFESRFGSSFSDYFVGELEALQAYEEEGFVTLSESRISITPIGSAFVRNLAMVFDAYLKQTQMATQFSRTV